MSKGNYIKIWASEIDDALEFFEGNNSDFHEYSAWLLMFLSGNSFEPKRKNVKLLVKAKKRGLQKLLEAKEFGSIGANKRLENQQVTSEPLQGGLQDPLKDPLQEPMQAILSIKEKDNIKVNINNKEKEKKPVANKLQPSNNFFEEVNLVFKNEYLESRGFEYVETRKNKSYPAIKKLLDHYKEKNPNANTQETLEGFRVYFKKALEIQDKFFYENMSIEFIHSNINKINSILKAKYDGKAIKSNPTASEQTSSDDVRRAVERAIYNANQNRQA